MQSNRWNEVLSPGGLQPVWTAAIATFIAGALFVIRAGAGSEAVLLLAAALAVSGVHLALAIGETVPKRQLSDRVVHVATPALLLAGLAWMVGGAANGASTAAARDGSILLLSAATVRALSSAQRFSREWLIAFSAAAAVTAAWSLFTPNARDAGASHWAIVALLMLAGITITSFPVILMTTAQRRQRRLRGSHMASWAAAGLCLVLLATWLAQESNSWAMWYLPGLSIAFLGLGFGRGEAPLPPTAIETARLLSSVPVWSAIMSAILVAVALITWLLATERSPERWGTLSLAASVLLTFFSALSIAGVLRSSSMLRLSSYAALLLRQSRTDPLTGLLNRRAISERLATEIQRAARFRHPFTIGLLDIDDFKSINDSWGHQVGDSVLQLVARRIEHELRQIDVVGRYGGEEFLFLLPETGAEGAWIAADRLLRSIRTLDFPGPGPHSVTVSIGLATFPEHGRTETDLIAAADAAIYAAKGSGKNQAVIAG